MWIDFRSLAANPLNSLGREENRPLFIPALSASLILRLVPSIGNTGHDGDCVGRDRRLGSRANVAQVRGGLARSPSRTGGVSAALEGDALGPLISCLRLETASSLREQRPEGQAGR